MKSCRESTTSSQEFEPMVGIDVIQDRLQVPKKSLYKWVYEHKITVFPYYKCGRHLRFRLSEVEMWLKKYRWSGSGDQVNGRFKRDQKLSAGRGR